MAIMMIAIASLMFSGVVMASASSAKSVTSVTKKHTKKCKKVRIKMKNGRLSP